MGGFGFGRMGGGFGGGPGMGGGGARKLAEGPGDLPPRRGAAAESSISLPAATEAALAPATGRPRRQTSPDHREPRYWRHSRSGRSQIRPRPGRIGGNNGGGGGGGAAGGMPPRGERRFVPDEVITAFASSATPAAIDQLARRHNLTQLEFAKLLVGRQHALSLAYRRPAAGRPTWSARSKTSAIVTSVQPNYLFTLQEDAAKVAAQTQNYAAQYVLGKLQVEEAHHVATGKNSWSP